jgi:hypothetical protein
VNRLIHPVGPEPAAVYWRRRAAVVAGIVIVIVLLVMIIKALASGPSSDAKSPPPTGKQSSAPAESGSAQPKIAACSAKQLAGARLAAGADILLTHDKNAYTAAEPVTLVAQVKNTSAEDCSLRNNPHTVVLKVMSGSDRIFDSSDCAANTPEDAGDLIVVKSGETTDIPISWDATRSQQGCREIAEKPFRAQDATYVATVKILDIASDETQFLLVP